MKKILLTCMFFGASVNALEFGYMGNKAFGMGGSGVALSSNPFSAYYNPALLGVDSGLKVGYSLGIRYKEYNISDLSNLNINTANNFLNDNSFNATSENGVAVQIPIPLGGIFSSAIGVGLFYTKIGTINFVANGINGVSKQTGENANAKVIINGLDLTEIPISYALNIFSSFGSFNIGVSAKYINAKHSLASQSFNSDSALEDAFNRVFDAKNGINTNAFGVDVGLSYSLPFNALVIGVVGKNLNSPNINTMGNERFQLDPQYRFGISTGIIPLTTLALDLDLKPNTEFRGLDNGMSKKQVQYISLGGAVDLTFMDIRLGLAKNLINGTEGMLVYGGFGFKLIDISLFSNVDTTSKSGKKIPTEFGIKIGGGFSF